MSTQTAQTITEDVVFLLEAREHPWRIARRLGYTTGALTTALRRAGRNDLAAKFYPERNLP